MAPAVTGPHRSGNHERYVESTTKKPSRFQSDLAPEDSELEVGALQTATEPHETAWEGFGNENQEDGSVSDVDSGDVGLEQTKKGKTILPKDAEEEELERMLFGDSAGFQHGLETFSLNRASRTYDNLSEDSEADDSGPDNLPDQDLFFFDSGPVPAPQGSIAVTHATESDDENDKQVWEDSDDERLVVSLASVPQMRKLRETVEDDLINGKEYSKRLRKQYERLYPTPNWAVHATGASSKKRRRTQKDDNSGDESASDMDVDDEDFSTQPLARLLKDADILSRSSRSTAKRQKLQAGTVDIQRLKNIAKAGPSAITSLSFHPTYPLIISSGPSSTLQLHHVNPNAPNPNPLLTSLHIKRTPLITTAFHPLDSDSRIFLSARRRYFHVWDIATGKVEKVTRVYGHEHEQRTMEYFALSPSGKHMALRGSSRKGGGVINILDAQTLQWTTQARVESRGGIADFAWWSDGSGLSIAGKNGEVTEWSVTEGVIGRWNDEGAVGTTVIALGGRSGRDSWLGGDRWVGVGSSSGVVNIYDRRTWSEADALINGADTTSTNGIPRTPKPVRALQNLTTPISHLHFSADGQILAMASRWKHNALRLVHLPSATVFKNWPTQKTPLGRISAVAWGRPSEEEEREGSFAQLAVANETGHIRLWEIRA